MKYPIIILFISTLLIYGCYKEQSTNYTATLSNNTQHKIVILFYKNGVVYPEDTIKLNPNDNLKIADGMDRGLSSVPGFTSKYFGGPTDSAIVVFDNIYKMSHYADTPLRLALRYYLFTSLRNIGNPNSYRFETTLTSKNQRNNKHYYTFIEQDYLDAK